MQRAVALLSLALVSPALAAAPVWGKCGGRGWTSDTECVAESHCVVQNEWYSQYLPGEGDGPTTTTTAILTTTTTTQQGPMPTGFVKTSGSRLTLNGSKDNVVGSNSYWVGLSQLSDVDMNQAFADIARTGASMKSPASPHGVSNHGPRCFP